MIHNYSPVKFEFVETPEFIKQVKTMSEISKSLLRGAAEALSYAKGNKKAAKAHKVKISLKKENSMKKTRSSQNFYPFQEVTLKYYSVTLFHLSVFCVVVSASPLNNSSVFHF